LITNDEMMLCDFIFFSPSLFACVFFH